MKIYAALAIVTTVLATQPRLRAQSCWVNVGTWTGNYMLSASSGGSVSCGKDMCTTNQSTAVNVNLNLLTCSGLEWANFADNVTKVSVNDIVVIPCPAGGTQTLNGASGGSSFDLLTLNVTSGTYVFWPLPSTRVTDTDVGCGGSSSETDAQFPLYPITNWPLTFSPLPKYVQPLSSGLSFTALGEPGGNEAGYEFSFTLKPHYNPDDDCKKKGGPRVPVGSSVGCQSQSLGEDMPVVGTRFLLHYESSRAPGAGGDSVARVDAAMIGGWTLSVHHAYNPNTNTLFVGDGSQRNGYQLGTPVSYKGNLLLTSEDGSEVYVFNGSTGQHLQTLRPLTGALEYQFGYDAVGTLVTVKDASGNVTTIQRNSAEQPTAIVSPYGQTTTLSVASSGSLSGLMDPLGKSAKFVTTTGGLLTSRTDANGNVFHYTYDSNGRLIKDADPLGGYIAAGRTDAASGFGWTVGQTTSMGRTTSYESALTIPWVENGNSTFLKEQTNTWPDGLHATSSKKLENGQISESSELPDGTSQSATSGPDPVWGLQVPVSTSERLTQGSATMNITGSRSTELNVVGNPFSVATKTDTEIINGRTFTSTFTASDRTYVNKTPLGRTLTVGLDSLERIASTQLGELTATDFSYDSRGRLASATQGTRKTTFNYNSNGFLASITDPLQLTTGFTYDADGHLSTTKLPDGRVIGYAYDANGNLTSVTPPGRPAHEFAYSAVDLPLKYTPPADADGGATAYTYDLDRDPTTVIRPDGEKIEYGYDSAGRLSSITTPTETVDYTYDPTTGNVTSASIHDGESLNYGYNGPLPTSLALAGKVTGTVSRTYDDNFSVVSESINSGSLVDFTYDKDGLVTNAGPLVITRDAKDGLITETVLGNTTESRTYDELGELTGKTAKYKTITLYSVTYARDADGRITTKTETVGTQKNAFTYTYDKAGRLTEVLKNGVHYSSYTYDSNSNRLTAAVSAGNLSGTYDTQDRLLTYGGSSFTYTANGELESQAAGARKTTYTYDALGNLIATTLPNGTKISYIVDPQSHRVGKEVNGAFQSGFLYNGSRIVAQLNGSNQIVSRFVYGTATSPDYMVRGGVTYRIFADQLGSPVLMVNTSSGAIAEQISYDEFGNVLSDTNPGSQPFGFAGGLYDQDTKLVRFGARDYDPSTGRWTAKDPVLFGGGDTNLYGYTLNDPINFYDDVGLEDTAADGGSELAGKVGEWVIETGEKVAHAQGEQMIDYPESGPPNLNPLPGRRLNEYVEANKPGAVENADSTWDLSEKIKRLWRICTDAIAGPDQPDGGNRNQGNQPGGPPSPPNSIPRAWSAPDGGSSTYDYQ